MAEFKWRHCEGEIILWAVRWYCRYGISYRDLEQMMGELGLAVDQSTIYCWVQRYAPGWKSASVGVGAARNPQVGELTKPM
jgi:IS6 family transposase